CLDAQQFRDAPRLRGAADRSMGSIAVVDLRDLAQSSTLEFRLPRLHPVTDSLARGRVEFVDLQIRLEERPQQPWPDRALVIRRIARALVAFIAAEVTWICGRQRAKSHRGEQFALDGRHDTRCPLAR